MQVIEQDTRFIDHPSYVDALSLVERAARVCYRSECKAEAERQEDFIKSLIKRGHHSLLEHISVTIGFTISRALLAELTRHRIGITFHVESTRYVKANKDGCEDTDIKFIRPSWLLPEDIDIVRRQEEGFKKDHGKDYVGPLCRNEAVATWVRAMRTSEKLYNDLLKEGIHQQFARGVLPLDLATNLVATVNFRELRHIFDLRSSRAQTGQAHPDMVRLMDDLLRQMREMYPAFFFDMIDENLNILKKG
jgi:thymidylate synthase (FAD)